MSTIVYDIEVAFYPEITKIAQSLGLDEKRFSEKIDAGMRYITHISYKIDKQPVVDLSLLDYSGSLEGDANEKFLLRDFAAAYNECDESVAHYGSKFDIRFLNSRIAKAGLPRLKPMRLIDTWRVLKDRFLLPSNRLETAIEYFKCPYGKPSLGWDIWRKVSLGDVKAHKVLRDRCHFDALSLWWIYTNKLMPYSDHSSTSFASIGSELANTEKIRQQLEKLRCGSCGGRGSLKREGYKGSKSAIKVQVSCRSCFCWDSFALKSDGTIKIPRFN